MQVRPLSIDGAWELTPVQHGDARGLFAEAFKADLLAEVIGHRFELAQVNLSVSAAGVLRGVHFADVPPGQAKYVSCARGAFLDVIIDIRVGSPTFGAHDTVLIDDADRRAVYLSEGLGHAICALEDNSTVTYLCSAGYNPSAEHGINPLDPDLGIDWPTTGRDGTPLQYELSAKDTAAPGLFEARDTGLLPSYDEVTAYLRSLAES
ncbi:dTDP-4-dehydrorhamnose 3,5-epimerase [Gordonia bronchialis DSM 43247]|uniref:dTDP-4-dehydrorhamnose 3,5-epimerase n=1 Tax=Gordonia bronchialis (strain ATCC 25592 / DSM 43247 / BCRC 13721 / JCM 3198 / KCTC 3076 / NBRC 16047 / NCTC 10667) TaxID=526226 RepID=D0LEK7_GORB4|nr:dTDP-4-dehydrorhamnose 3,5-epimerase [Gordonia bronchialis]ACY19925.1 dTDP-4-dehydrorhamnose 3,5-epimerase [Gordonia bronchialis DSM 43247]MCC3322698.1 dTDP-4-dehydrorhamnose 3,5-epimerase [Gordonia bronchialis]QGS26211.1 dTDP-4-dehydrorhamnose 3,5-epimerase [Gordonia bronchialis]STQ62703.1 dTDP-4-dehydrorhamnose 3,5-epimerase [Gordonia bronchialis]